VGTLFPPAARTPRVLCGSIGLEAAAGDNRDPAGWRTTGTLRRSSPPRSPARVRHSAIAGGNHQTPVKK